MKTEILAGETQAEFGGSYENISDVEVMLQCPKCGYDNGQKAKKCDECGKKIQ